MKNFLFASPFRFTQYAFIFLVLCSCAQDRDSDDFKRDKLNEDLAKVEQISGSYLGTLVSTYDGSDLGVVGVKIEADTKVDSFNEQKPVLKGMLYFKSNTAIKIIFQNSYYEEETQIFKSSMIAPSNPNQLIELSGKIEGSKLAADLESFGYPELGARMTLEKSFSAQDFDSTFMPQADTKVNPVELIDRKFEGIFNGKKMHLSLSNKSFQPEDRFLEYFLPERRLDVTLKISIQNDLVFTNAKWDTRNNSFFASNTRNSSEGPFQTTLECKEVIGNPKSEGTAVQMNCDYVSLLNNRRNQFSVTEVK